MGNGLARSQRNNLLVPPPLRYSENVPGVLAISLAMLAAGEAGHGPVLPCLPMSPAAK
jgi:hypothetical protein